MNIFSLITHLFTISGSQRTTHASRITHHDSRITTHDSRFTGRTRFAPALHSSPFALHPSLFTFHFSLFTLLLFFLLSLPGTCETINYSSPPGTDIHLITVDLNDPSVYVTPLVPPGFDAIEDTYPVAAMDRIIELYHPKILINGTYFDLNEGYPIGNLVMDGNLVNEGYNGSALCIDYNNRLDFLLFTGCIGRYLDLSRWKSVICSGPTLVYKGNTYYFNPQEGHKDQGLYRNTRRSVLGITGDNKLLITGIGRDVSLQETGRIMKSLGAYYACNLDGGTSTGLYVDGKYLIRPGRTVSNFLAVFDKKPSNLYIPPSLNKYFEEKQEKEANELSQEAEGLLRDRCYSDAQSLFIEACEKDQDNAIRYLDVARTSYQLGDYEEESKYMAKTGMVYLQKGIILFALFYADKALQIDPENKLAMEIKHLATYPEFLLGGMYLFRNKITMAEYYFLKAIEKNPEEPRFYYALGTAYWKSGLKEKASDTYLKSCELFLKKDLPFDAYCAALNGVRTDPHNKEARIAFAEIAIMREKYDSAIVHLQIAHMLAPEDKKVIKLLEGFGFSI